MAPPQDSSDKPPKPAAKPPATVTPAVKRSPATSPITPAAPGVASPAAKSPEPPRHPAPNTPVLLRRTPASGSGPVAPPRVPAPSVVRPISGNPGPRSAGAAPGAAQGAQLEALLAALEAQDYFQILKVEKSANPAEIKRAFHRVSRAYHPDRYYQLADGRLKERIIRVYKRMTEAYYVLRDDAKRDRYIADIEGPDRAQKLRFTEVAEVETKMAVKKQAEEQIGTTPRGRQFYAAGLFELEAQRWSAADRSLKIAVTYEPSNARYKEKLAEAQRKIYEEMKQKGESFKIK